MNNDAHAAVHALLDSDATFAALGMKLISVSDGSVTLSLVIRPDMTNGGDVAHGGWIFLLADTAFAFTAATRMPGTLTTDADIRYHRPALRGERLIAEGVLVHEQGTSVLVDVTVSNPAGERVASFRGGGRAPRRATPTA
jgi:acyl-CoA thioesterase